MSALARLWRSVGLLADALERLAGRVELAADSLGGREEGLTLPHQPQAALEANGTPETAPALPRGRSKKQAE